MPVIVIVYLMFFICTFKILRRRILRFQTRKRRHSLETVIRKSNTAPDAYNCTFRSTIEDIGTVTLVLRYCTVRQK